ncbi:MAG: type III-A CRISPR-associated RAMP protein Csm5, partial [Bacteroidetes bacterium]|nr:type III-A CRISPR-associated RAMP protein Csm5 [Bacteroidota bacterium]
LYIDQKKLEKTLSQPDHRHLIDAYTEALTQVDNNRSRLELKSFLNNHLPDADLFRIKIRNYGMEPQNRLPVTSIIKTASRPFIPGSSLKGAIRTALLYDWLQNTGEGEQELTHTYDLVKRSYRTYQELIPLRIRKKRRERLEGWEFKQLKDGERKLREDITYMLNEQRLFGKINSQDFSPDSQHIQISDSDFFAKDDFGVFNAARVRLQSMNQFRGRSQAKNQIPQPREALLKGKETSFSLVLRTEKMRNSAFDKLKTNTRDELLSLIRQFTKATIGLELYYLESANEMQTMYQNALVRFYEDLYDRSEEGETFLRIGMGKTYFDNSLGIALMNYAEDKHREGEKAFIEFREVVLGVHPEKFFFPVTRTISTNPVMPFGWIKIT